ncbi:MAG: aldose 1-epimerase [Chloroflexi bacterium]|nr:aldose 1-epimerase [Chloroflexota bacterium]
MSRFTVERIPEHHDGADAYELRDSAAGSSARLVPARGINLLSFVGSVDECPVETILGPTPDQASASAFTFGNAILFPFPNRIRQSRFRWRGREYPLRPNWRGEHQIHGLITDHPWSLVRAAGTEAGALLHSRLVPTDDPVVAEQYPFPCRLDMIYTLCGGALRVDVTIENTGEGEMPFGFGMHPYFRMPLAAGGDRARCLVEVPAGRQWALDGDCLPTGEVVPVPPERDFRRLRAIGDLSLDDVYTDVAFAGDSTRCRLSDPAAEVELQVEFGRQFREIVVYAPPSRPTICFEPYTCPTDAANLEDRGVPAGVLTLAPGASWSAWVVIRVGRG